MTLEARIVVVLEAIGTDVKSLAAAIELLQERPQITVSATPPEDPKTDDLWVDTSSN